MVSDDGEEGGVSTTVEPTTTLPAVHLDDDDGMRDVIFVVVVVKACETDERRCRLTHMAAYRLVDLMVLFRFRLSGGPGSLAWIGSSSLAYMEQRFGVRS